jgi:hypothetical protein
LATLLATKLKEKLSDESLEDYNFLKQCKHERVSELISTSDSETADEDLRKEMHEFCMPNCQTYKPKRLSPRVARVLEIFRKRD